MTSRFVFGLTFLPFSILAAIVRSDSRAFAQEPRKTELMGSVTWLTGFAFAGECGSETVGSIEEASTSTVFEKVASRSLLAAIPRTSSVIAILLRERASLTYAKVLESGFMIAVLALISTE